jgi:predicted amidohydrolase YtcJ
MSDLRRRKPPQVETTAADNSVADEPENDKARQPHLAASTSSRSFVEASLMFLVFALATAWPVYILLGRRGTDIAEDSILSGHGAYALCSREGHQVYTVNDHNEVAQCIAVYQDKILATGDLEYVQKRWAALATSSNDLSLQGHLAIHYLKPGSAVIPGLSDSHAHILEYGASRQLVLEGTKSIKETITRVRNHVLGDPELFQDTSIWIFGSNWDQTAWTPQAWPTVDDLENDPVLRGRRIVLQSKDYHAIWVSRQVMQAIPEIPDSMEGGAIMRDHEGKPTGVFLDSAQSLVQRPPPSEKELEKRLAITARDALSLGITSIHDAGFKPISLDFFTKQASERALPIRIYGMSYFNQTDPYWGDKRQHLIGHGGGRLTCRSVKIFADGAKRRSSPSCSIFPTTPLSHRCFENWRCGTL